MKKLFRSIFILTLVFATSSLFAQKEKEKNKEDKRYEFFKERDISKTYPASGNSLNVENSFGSVKVTTWDKNEIKVDVHIEASSDNKEYAEKIFSRIDVTESKDGNKIKFKTEHKDNDKKEDGCKNCKSNMKINYTIQLPAGNTLNIDNSFGSTEIPDFKGAVSLSSKFGSLTAGNLANVEKLNVEFGSATIESISNADVEFKFSTIKVEKLSGKNKINMEFCGSSRINLANDLTALDLRESYSTVNLKPVANFSATYTITTSFGSFKNKTNAEINRTDTPEKYGPDSDKKYEGKSGSGGAKIDVKSSFGTIILGEATDEEMKSKNKEKKTLS
jgi:hypothetical protein